MSCPNEDCAALRREHLVTTTAYAEKIERLQRVARAATTRFDSWTRETYTALDEALAALKPGDLEG